LYSVITIFLCSVASVMSCMKLFECLKDVLGNNSTSQCWINAKIGREQCIALTTSALTTSCKALSRFSRSGIFIMCNVFHLAFKQDEYVHRETVSYFNYYLIP